MEIYSNGSNEIFAVAFHTAARYSSKKLVVKIKHNNNNRPDIIIKNKKEKTCTLIDVAIPADRNVVQKEA